MSSLLIKNLRKGNTKCKFHYFIKKQIKPRSAEDWYVNSQSQNAASVAQHGLAACTGRKLAHQSTDLQTEWSADPPWWWNTCSFVCEVILETTLASMWRTDVLFQSSFQRSGGREMRSSDKASSVRHIYTIMLVHTLLLPSHMNKFSPFTREAIILRHKSNYLKLLFWLQICPI